MANLTVLVFDTLMQTRAPREEQLLAAAAVLSLITDAYKASPQETFTAVRNLMADEMHPDKMEHRFSAMRFYLDHELRGVGY